MTSKLVTFKSNLITLNGNKYYWHLKWLTLIKKTKKNSITQARYLWKSWPDLKAVDKSLKRKWVCCFYFRIAHSLWNTWVQVYVKQIGQICKNRLNQELLFFIALLSCQPNLISFSFNRNETLKPSPEEY